MLTVSNLDVKIKNRDFDFHVLRGVTFDVRPNEVLGILGESGSGKSILAKEICALNNTPIKRVGGSIIMSGIDTANNKTLHKDISMIFQHPTSALNPVITIGNQLIETILFHKICTTKDEAYHYAVSLLESTGIQHPTDRMNAYPHQLSGGMNQRVMIAMALSVSPKLLIADEPTTALDVITQAQIITLLKNLGSKKDFSLIFVTHDLSLMQKIADRVVVMYSGEVMEIISGDDLRNGRIKHPCTKALKDCLPSVSNKSKRLFSIPGQMQKNTSDFACSCIFNNRCQYLSDLCTAAKPQLVNGVSCHHPLYKSH